MPWAVLTSKLIASVIYKRRPKDEKTLHTGTEQKAISTRLKLRWGGQLKDACSPDGEVPMASEGTAGVDEVSWIVDTSDCILEIP